MSILDRDELVTSGRPRSYGDQLPNKAGDRPRYKDGLEDNWTYKEAKAIRGLASGYRPETVARKLHVKMTTMNRWMGNPYFMMEVQRLADHYLFKYRPKVLETVALRAIAGSAQHARIFLQVSRDLTPDDGRTPNKPNDDVLSGLTDEELDERLRGLVEGES